MSGELHIEGYAALVAEERGDILCIAAPLYITHGEVVSVPAISSTGSPFARRSDWLSCQVSRASNYSRAQLRLALVSRYRATSGC
jgi:transcriptional regulator of acetoin/glycerol metabolism